MTPPPRGESREYKQWLPTKQGQSRLGAPHNRFVQHDLESLEKPVQSSRFFYFLPFDLGSLPFVLVPSSSRASSLVLSLLAPEFDFFRSPDLDKLLLLTPCSVIAFKRCSCFLVTISSRLQIRMLKPVGGKISTLRNSSLLVFNGGITDSTNLNTRFSYCPTKYFF